MSKMVSLIFEQKEPIRLVLCSDRSTGHLVTRYNMFCMQLIVPSLLKEDVKDTELTNDIKYCVFN